MGQFEVLKYLASLSINNKVYPVQPNSFEDTKITKADFGGNFIWGVSTAAYLISSSTVGFIMCDESIFIKGTSRILLNLKTSERM